MTITVERLTVDVSVDPELGRVEILDSTIDPSEAPQGVSKVDWLRVCRLLLPSRRLYTVRGAERCDVQRISDRICEEFGWSLDELREAMRQPIE